MNQSLWVRVDVENKKTGDKIKPKLHVDTIHIEFYDKDEVDKYLEELRQGIIEDIKIYHSNEYNDFIIDIINRRFEND